MVVGTAQYTRIQEDARRFEALGYPVRLLLLTCIIEGEGLLSAWQLEDMVCTELGYTITQPTISHHLRHLIGAGLIEGRRSNVEIYYRVRGESLALCMDALTLLIRRQE